MMVARLRTILAVTFVVLTAVLLIWFKLSQPRILVLHSYDLDYSWSRDITTGMRRVLDPKLSFQVQWHYMDVKNHPWEDYKRKAAATAKRAIEAARPDVIIAIDDDAQEYVAKDLVNDPRVSIVFAGINGEIEPYGYHKAANVTGILERKPLRELRDALKTMHRDDGLPLARRIVHIGDRSGSVLADTVEIEALDWAPFKLIRSRLVDSFDEWQVAVREAASEGDLILVSNYRSLYQDRTRSSTTSPEEVVRWTEEHSRLPVVGIGGFFVEDGGMFALGASGFEQGDVIGRMTVRVLEGKALPREIPVVEPKQFISYMRPKLLEKRGITMPALYASFARATNNYFE